MGGRGWSFGGWSDLQSGLLQVVEVGHAWAGLARESVSVLPALAGHLLGVGVSLGAAQGRAVAGPVGVQHGAPEHIAPLLLLLLPALQLGRGRRRVAPAFGERPFGGGGVGHGEGLVAQVGRLIGLRRREVEQLPQRPQGLALEEGNTAEAQQPPSQPERHQNRSTTAWEHPSSERSWLPECSVVVMDS